MLNVASKPFMLIEFILKFASKPRMLGVITVNVVMLSAIMLNVVAPGKGAFLQREAL
jgi:hypothetical protein